MKLDCKTKNNYCSIYFFPFEVLPVNFLNSVELDSLESALWKRHICLLPVGEEMKTLQFCQRSKIKYLSYLAYSSLSSGWAGRTCSDPAEFEWLGGGPRRWSQGEHQYRPKTQTQTFWWGLVICVSRAAKLKCLSKWGSMREISMLKVFERKKKLK